MTLTRDGEPIAEGATVRLVDAVSGSATRLVLGADGVLSAGLPAGNYRAEVADAFDPVSLVVGGLPVTPDAENAYLTIVPAGARGGAFDLTSTAQARDGSPARLTAPDEPGDYEVRYVLSQGNQMLVGVPIVVR